MPFPAEPKVKKGDVEVFKKANRLIQNKLPQTKMVTRGGGERSLGDEIPAGEITFHEKIGAHDISVAHVLNTEKFVEWVQQYLKSMGVSDVVIPEILKSTITQYISDDFQWFAFDIVDLDDKPKTNDAIQYRFATSALFYPLRISRTNRGQTSVDMLVLTTKMLNVFKGIPAEQIHLRYSPVSISMQEIKELNEDMADLIGPREDLKLRIWDLKGDITSFDQDIFAETDDSK